MITPHEASVARLCFWLAAGLFAGTALQLAWATSIPDLRVFWLLMVGADALALRKCLRMVSRKLVAYMQAVAEFRGSTPLKPESE